MKSGERLIWFGQVDNREEHDQQSVGHAPAPAGHSSTSLLHLLSRFPFRRCAGVFASVCVAQSSCKSWLEALQHRCPALGKVFSDMKTNACKI